MKPAQDSNTNVNIDDVTPPHHYSLFTHVLDLIETLCTDVHVWDWNAMQEARWNVQHNSRYINM